MIGILDEARSILASYGPLGLLAVAAYFILAQPEKVDVWRAKLLEFVSWAGSGWRRRQIAYYLQGNINQFGKSINSLEPGVMPSNLKIQFVGESDGAELLRNSNTVLVRIRDRVRDDKNLVHAMLAFCPIGVLP